MSQKENTTSRAADLKLVLFDGYCPFCSGAVRFLIRLDRRRQFTFATLSSETAGNLKIQVGRECLSEDTVLYYHQGELLCLSDAAFAIAAELPFPWPLLAVFRFIPRFLRDRLYRMFARWRYRLFGKYDQCMLPGEEEKDRFLY